MKMIIFIGKKKIELNSVKSGEWDIETRESLRSDVNHKLDLVSWKIIKRRKKK